MGRMSNNANTDYLERTLDAETQRDANMYWQALPIHDTPWGEAQHSAQLGEHVWSVVTAGHGGIYAEQAVLNIIPPAVRRCLSGRKWFEEDIEMYLAMVFLWEVCSPSAIRREWNGSFTRMTFVVIAERMAGEYYPGCLEDILAVKKGLVKAGFPEEEENKEYILEIAGDLESNLERIRSHGDRANRIVEDMLRMGGDSGEKRLTDLNRVMEDHTKLAYHSARALNTDFNLTIKEDYDPTLGEMEVIPQDMGRLFLNLVGNACYATNQRRLAVEASGKGERFMPTLRLSSHRKADRVVFRVGDNGGGIPSEIVDDIFNPFFTTKPSDQGTGLGLALSSDIARQHGGLIRVETEQGESTTMIVELPLAETPIAPAATDTETRSG